MDELILQAKPVTPSEQVHFRCKGCGTCCRHVRESVPLDSLDAFRLAKSLRFKDEKIQNMDDVFASYAEPVLLDGSGFSVFMLKTCGEDDACVFLKENRCTIHDAKPRACRLYPFTIEPKEGGGFKYLLSTEQAHHFKGASVQAKHWIKKFFPQEDREFLRMDLQSAVEIVQLLRRIPDSEQTRALALFLWYRFSDYDLDRPFLEQYERNNRQLIKMLGSLTVMAQAHEEGE